MPTISRQEHAALFGPTVGDKIRIGDTDLFVEIEKDLRHYGDESMYGGGKTLRGGMGGGRRAAAPAAPGTGRLSGTGNRRPPSRRAAGISPAAGGERAGDLPTAGVLRRMALCLNGRTAGLVHILFIEFPFCIVYNKAITERKEPEIDGNV